MAEKCFACGKALKGRINRVDTRDDQTVYVGSDCSRHVAKAGEIGWQGGCWDAG